MKRLSAFVLILALVFVFSGCDILDSGPFYNERVNYENFDTHINRLSNKCFVGQYNCTEYTENMEITIPDYYDGVPVTTLGGYFGKGMPTPFCISVADIYMNAEEGSEYGYGCECEESPNRITENYPVVEVPFTLNIGENISEIRNVIKYVYYPHVNEDGSVTYYTPVVEINCDENNEHFYSEDGKLYDKKTDELIEDFAYKN